MRILSLLARAGALHFDDRRCYEVQCNPEDLTDKFGHKFDRSSVCYDAAASVVVRTTDSCPCNYHQNYYSNRRWCCGDMNHFDLSIWAFEKLASTKWGVMGIKYRAVPCNYQPAVVAPEPANPFPGEAPPVGAKMTNRWASEGTFDPQQLQAQIAAGTSAVYRGGAVSPWSVTSWFAKRLDGQQGESGGTAACARTYPSGVLAFEAPKAQFSNKISLELWVKTDSGVPEVAINLSGNGKSCRPVKLQDMSHSGEKNGWSRYDLYLGLFAPIGPSTVVAFTPAFKGCGSASPADLDRIELLNTRPYEQDLCVDGVKLIGE